MITLGVAQIQYFSAFQLTSITGGENGLNLGSRGTLFGIAMEDDHVFYYVAFVLIALGVWLAMRVVESPSAASCRRCVRTSSARWRWDTASIGTSWWSSSSRAGWPGSPARCTRSQPPGGLEMVDWHTSGAVVMMTVLGGIGTISAHRRSRSLRIAGILRLEDPDRRGNEPRDGLRVRALRAALPARIVGSFLVPRTTRAKT